jgi:2-iminobutanoate/2-iminopropanoate deaminase
MEKPSMNISRNPATMAAPIGPFCHTNEVPEGSRMLYISGQVGMLPDGSIPESIEAQAEATWQNIKACLADAGMSVADLVKITTFVVRAEDLRAAGKARAEHLGEARPTSSTIIVSALVVPSLLIEIEAVAAAKA